MELHGKGRILSTEFSRAGPAASDVASTPGSGVAGEPGYNRPPFTEHAVNEAGTPPAFSRRVRDQEGHHHRPLGEGFHDRQRRADS